MFASRIGECAALITALCWTFGALAFESACRRAGALAVNWIRLVIGFILLSLFCLFYRGMIIPADASLHSWLWLTLSGIIGFAVGDYLLFRAFIVIGARISMLMMSAVPPMTAIIGWIILNETLSLLAIAGMLLVVGGIVLVVLERKTNRNHVERAHPISGIVLALGAAGGQAVGLILSKYGMRQYDPFAATQIRVISAIAGFSILLLFARRWSLVSAALRKPKSLGPTTIGAVLGPFLGVSFSLLAVQRTTTGIASTIMAIVPVLIIPPAVILYKEKITVKEVIGAVIAVTGVALLFI